MPELTAKQIGILRDIKANKISIDEISDWMRDQLVDLIFHEPQMIDVDGPSVFLTPAGHKAISTPQG